MKKIYSFIFALIIGAVSANATYRSVTITRHDGSSVRVGIESDIKASINEGFLVFASSKGEISFPMEEVNKWTFSTTPGDNGLWSSIEVSESGAVGFASESNRLIFRNLQPGERVTLTAVDGRTVVDTVCNDSSLFEIATNDMTPGVYVVRYSDHSLKIVLNR